MLAVQKPQPVIQSGIEHSQTRAATPCNDNTRSDPTHVQGRINSASLLQCQAANSKRPIRPPPLSSQAMPNQSPPTLSQARIPTTKPTAKSKNINRQPLPPQSVASTTKPTKINHPLPPLSQATPAAKPSSTMPPPPSQPQPRLVVKLPGRNVCLLKLSLLRLIPVR